MAQVSTYPLAGRVAGDFLLGTNAAGLVKRFSESGREILRADRTYFVRTDGNNANTGLVDSAGGAFAGWEFAYEYIVSRIDFGGYTVSIAHGDEGVGVKTFNESIVIDTIWVGGGFLVLTGNANDLVTPSNLVISSLAASNGAITITAPISNISIRGMKIIDAFGYGCVNMWAVGALTIGGAGSTEIGSGAVSQIWAGAPGAQISIASGCTFSGGALVGLFMTPNAAIFMAASIALSGTPVYGTTGANAFVSARDNSYFEVSTGIFTGSGATGRRFYVAESAVINTGGLGTSFFPGDAAGLTDSATYGVYL